MVTLTFVAHRTQRDGRAASVSRFAEAEPQSERVANTSPLGRRSRIFARFCRHWFTNGLLRAPHFIVNRGTVAEPRVQANTVVVRDVAAQEPGHLAVAHSSDGGSEERCRDVAPQHMRWRGLDPGDRTGLGIDADHDDRLTPVSTLDDRRAAGIRVVTPHPCEKHSVAGWIEVERNVMPTVGRGMGRGRRGVEREVRDPPRLGKDIDEELGSRSSGTDPVADFRSGRGHAHRRVKRLRGKTRGREDGHVLGEEC